MKHVLSIFLFALYFSGLSQNETSTERSNSELDIPTDSVTVKKITTKNQFLLSDSSLRFFDSMQNPNYCFLPSYHHSIPNFSRSFFTSREKILKEVQETQNLLLYSIGSKNTQVLDIHHIQKISKKINAEIIYRKNKTDGFYQNQILKSDWLDGNFQIKNEKENYFILPYFKFLKKNISENGGIDSDSLFKTGNFTNSMTLTTRLSGASNEWEMYDGGIDQILKFKKNKTNFTLEDNLSYRYQKRTYSDDPQQSYYDTIYLDTALTNDRYQYSAYHHTIGVHAFQQKWNAHLFNETEISNYRNGGIDTNFVSNKIALKLNYLSGKSSFKIVVNYFISGFNKNNYSIFFKYEYILNKKIESIFLKANYKNYYSYFQNYRIDVNNYNWNNVFNNSTDLSFHFRLKTIFGNLQLSDYILNNYILLNTDILPEQISNGIQLFSAEYSKSFTAKNIHLDIRFQYQKTTKGEAYYRVPEIITSIDLSYLLQLKSMPTTIGIKGIYFSEFFANSYDPSLNSFYLQNEVKTGNYPFLDFYVQSKVKTVELKFMISHFNSGFTGFNYYTTPLYPMAPRNFQFSLIWFFRD